MIFTHKTIQDPLIYRNFPFPHLQPWKSSFVMNLKLIFHCFSDLKIYPDKKDNGIKFNIIIMGDGCIERNTYNQKNKNKKTRNQIMMIS